MHVGWTQRAWQAHQGPSPRQGCRHGAETHQHINTPTYQHNTPTHQHTKRTQRQAQTGAISSMIRGVVCSCTPSLEYTTAFVFLFLSETVRPCFMIAHTLATSPLSTRATTGAGAGSAARAASVQNTRKPNTGIRETHIVVGTLDTVTSSTGLFPARTRCLDSKDDHLQRNGGLCVNLLGRVHRPEGLGTKQVIATTAKGQ